MALFLLVGRLTWATKPLVQESGWKAVTGKVIVNYLSDRDPCALRLAVAKDSPTLRAKCVPGVLYFSKLGKPVQTNLSWDFDGDYFQIITNEKLVNSFRGDASPLPVPDFEKPSQTAVEIKSLVDVHAHFLTEYHQKDQIGILHWKWEMLAGKGPTAAGSPDARKVAAAYCKSLDVEKGKPCSVFCGWVDSKEIWDFMKGSPGKPSKPSPTATGECSRKAKAAHQEFLAAAKPTSRGLDPELEKAWAEVVEKLGPEKRRELTKLAEEARGKLIEGIKDQCQKAESCLRSKNPFATYNDDIVAQQWLADLRTATQEKAKENGFSLSEVALAGWRLKYVDQGVHQRTEDPDPSFPWTLFEPELLGRKEQQQPCLWRELRQSHRLLRKLQRAAVQAEDATKESKVKEAIKAIQDIRMKCPHCFNALEKLLAKLHLDGTPGEIVEAINFTSGVGRKERVDCKDLRFAKECIPDVLENGPGSGTKLTELVDRLVKGEEPTENLVLTAVRFHDQLFVVEGNRRLWCLQQAERRLQKPIVVSVHVPDLYFGFIRRQEHKEPALSYFLERFDSSCEGKTVKVVPTETKVPPQAASTDSPVCPKCSGQMLRKTNGKDLSQFWGCAKFPQCRATINIPLSADAPSAPATPAPHRDVQSCPSCGGVMVQRTNRTTGEPFLGCSRYPTCKRTQSIAA
eukprot:Skav227220  [mRNA]  locus=scaffold2048:463173:465227:- [translate_table: standard]